MATKFHYIAQGDRYGVYDEQNYLMGYAEKIAKDLWKGDPSSKADLVFGNTRESVARQLWSIAYGRMFVTTSSASA